MGLVDESELVAVGARFLAAVAARDFAAVGACFAEDAGLQALTPHQLREEHGRMAIAARYAYWLGPLAGFAVVEADAAVVADRLRVRYRFHGVDPAHGPQANDHTAYARVERGLIVELRLTCAGFRPDPSAPPAAATATPAQQSGM